MQQRNLTLSPYESFEREGEFMEFAPGDTVQLKSGGPIMTVEQGGEYWSIEGTAVWCVWFEKVGNKQVASRETFAAVALDKAERPGFASFQVTRG